MPKQSKPKAKRPAPKSTAAGRALLASLNQALAYARVLLAVIAHHPDAVEDALRKAS